MRKLQNLSLSHIDLNQCATQSISPMNRLSFSYSQKENQFQMNQYQQIKHLNQQHDEIKQLSDKLSKHKSYINKLELLLLKGISGKEQILINNELQEEQMHYLQQELEILQKEKELQLILQKENQQLKNENNILKQIMVQLNKNNNPNMIEEIIKIKKENEQLLIELENLEVLNEQYRNKCKEIQNDFDQLQAEYDQLRKENSFLLEHQKQLLSIQQETQFKNKQIQQNQIEIYQNELQTLQSKANEVNNSKEFAQQMRQDLEIKEIVTLRLKGENSKLITQVEKLKQINKKCLNLVCEYQDIGKENETMTAENLKLMDSKRQANKEITLLIERYIKQLV